MIICPNCHHKEPQGALFCSDCGAQLITLDGQPTQLFSEESSGALRERVKREKPAVDPGRLIGSLISLHILEAGQILPLYGREEYVIGRAAEEQQVHPDVDLTPYRAYEKGVSRLHASIKLKDRQVTITDLGSVNGTRVNGKKIIPNETYPLNHGDILSLGKLRVQIIIRQSALE